MLVHLVRHGRPVIDPHAPARDWTLDPAHLPEVRALRDALPRSAREGAWFSSDEPKALLTARQLSDGEVVTVPELQEARRHHYLQDQAAFAEAVRRGLRDPATAALPGWEPLELTRQRVSRVVATIIGREPRDVVLVGHGTAWTLLAAELLGEARPRAVPRMSMPDLMVLDLSERTVLSPWGGWRDRELG